MFRIEVFFFIPSKNSRKPFKELSNIVILKLFDEILQPSTKNEIRLKKIRVHGSLKFGIKEKSVILLVQDL